MDPNVETTIGPGDEDRFPCGRCGANLVFRPGADHVLSCLHCGHDNPIPEPSGQVVELDLARWLSASPSPSDGARSGGRSVTCETCGARVTLWPELTADRCAFCGSPVVVADSWDAIAPQGVLPFLVGRDDARRRVRAWIRGRRFAPRDFVRWAASDDGGLQGIYLPYWTFDSETSTEYEGLRGEHYWVTETYTTRENGRQVTKTRQVRKTRWYPASGTVHVDFDDLLVCGSRSLPDGEIRALEPWDLARVVAYRPHYLSGFRAQTYELDLAEGWHAARERMEEDIVSAIRSDIGGDQQQVGDFRTAHRRPTFKRLLLPVWLGAYRYRERAYRILVNARTGEVQGERPWSVWKIAAAVVLIALAVALLVYVTTLT